jgi:hypothetical protein
MLAIISLAIVAAVAAALAVFEHFAGEHPLADALYDWRLRRLDLQALDRAALRNPRRSDIIVTLTTLPSRIERIDSTLKSLLRQTVSPAEVRLHVPLRSHREATTYSVPERVRRLQSVTVVPCEDFGPATKLIPALADAASDERLLVVDDDRIYHPWFIEQMQASSDRHPDAAIASSGWNAPTDLVDRPSTLLATLRRQPPTPIKCTRVAGAVDVDVMQGLGGYLVRPRFFEAAVADYSGAPEAAFFVDDVWISAHCRARKIVCGGRRTNFESFVDRRFYKRSSVALVNRGTGTLESRNNTIMLKYFGDRWRRS